MTFITISEELNYQFVFPFLPHFLFFTVPIYTESVILTLFSLIIIIGNSVNEIFIGYIF